MGPVSFVSPSTTSATAPVDLTPLAELVRRTFGTELQASPMPGGASTRRYYRLELPSGRSAVAMFVPEGGKEVPTILAEDTDRGWLVIEDLGDDTLANWLLRSPADKPALYTLAVTDLARAQRDLAALPAGSVVASRTFDFDLLRWEVEHFREWGLDARGKPLAAADVARWSEISDRLARRLAALPYGFVHRDYQSRNLMVGTRSDGAHRLVWIDFQDALLGPRVYDLVALLNDSYQEFDRAFVEARLAEYAAAAGLPASELPKLVDEFDLVTVQRKLKDAGRFVFIDRMKNNSSFLKFVTPTIVKVGAALARLAARDPDMAELRDILRRALGDELGS